MSQLREKILSDSTLLSSDLNRIIATAPHRYKVFYIEKKIKGEYRTIAQPAKELKTIQNWLVSYLSDFLPVHDSAMAYSRGKSIKDNATRHNNKRYVLKMDFEDFFPCINKDHMVQHLSKYASTELTGLDVDDVCNIVLWSAPNKRGRFLSVGAPSSPFISNSIMFDFDTITNDFCNSIDVSYTRYADDLVFSTNIKNVLEQVENFISKLITNLDYPKLTINKKKTRHTSIGRGIYVTGIVLTPNGKLSIGRERKRTIRSAIHYFINSKLNYEEVEKLNGLLAFAYDIEPEFVASMKKKYGEYIHHKIKKYLADNIKNK